MKRLALVAALAIALSESTVAWAQGVNQPSTPNNTFVIVNPPLQAPPNATPNVPSQVLVPPLGGSRARSYGAQPYHGPTTRGRGSAARR
jgi:hypothetical protein